MSKQQKPIAFEVQHIQIRTSARKLEVEACVGIGTGMAYHQVPVGTVLHKRLPEAYMITEQRRHSSVTCATFPADTSTAEACIAYLSEHMDDQISPLTLIDQFAQIQGCWYRLDEAGDE
jgi:hypothetical protein